LQIAASPVWNLQDRLKVTRQMVKWCVHVTVSSLHLEITARHLALFLGSPVRMSNPSLVLLVLVSGHTHFEEVGVATQD